MCSHTYGRQFRSRVPVTWQASVGPAHATTVTLSINWSPTFGTTTSNGKVVHAEQDLATPPINS